MDSSYFNGAAYVPAHTRALLRGDVSNIIFAKPGDAHWTQATPPSTRCTAYLPDPLSLLSLGARCYIASPPIQCFTSLQSKMLMHYFATLVCC
jgi:hypothetical protein